MSITDIFSNIFVDLFKSFSISRIALFFVKAFFEKYCKNSSGMISKYSSLSSKRTLI